MAQSGCGHSIWFVLCVYMLTLYVGGCRQCPCPRIRNCKSLRYQRLRVFLGPVRKQAKQIGQRCSAVWGRIALPASSGQVSGVMYCGCQVVPCPCPHVALQCPLSPCSAGLSCCGPRPSSPTRDSLPRHRPLLLLMELLLAPAELRFPAACVLSKNSLLCNFPGAWCL